jgi:sulfide:quinone oxidoreductase
MPESSVPFVPFRVLIAGGGVAAVEAALALQDLAGQAVAVTLLAPEPDFVYRPMSVREPFSYAGARHYPLDAIAADTGADLIRDSFAWVNPSERIVHTTEGHALSYDALILAVGATPYERFPHATTIDDQRIDEIYRGVIRDVEEGYTRRIAFVMPEDASWPLPLYELALMTAERANAMCVDVDLTVVTPERTPLAIFGTEASAAVSALLDERGIAVECGARAQIPSKGKVTIFPGDRTFDVDRIVALPELVGPSIRGLLVGDKAFIPVDDHCRVRGVDRIYAAGDATEFPVKHGGLSTQQADTAAADIARLAGCDVEAGPLRPHVEGMLLTGREPLYISATVTGANGFHSNVSREPLWSPPTKIAARYLSPYLDRLDHAVA